MMLKESFRMQNELNALSAEAMYFMTTFENMIRSKKSIKKAKAILRQKTRP